MVSLLVRATISSAYTVFSGCSERSKQVIGQAKYLIGQISDEENLDHFDDFTVYPETATLLGTGAAGCARDINVQVWPQFHGTQLTTLWDIWKLFYTPVPCVSVSQEILFQPLMYTQIHLYITQIHLYNTEKARKGNCRIHALDYF